MRIYAIGYFEGDTYKVKRVKANTVAEAHKKANLDTPIVRIQREEYTDVDFLRWLEDHLDKGEDE